MGIQINGNTDNISAVDGDLSITGITTFSQLDVGNNIKLGNAGVITATSFVGSGANLTGISAGTSLSGSTNNTVCTVTGANAIQGEANLTFDGSTLAVTGQITPSSHINLASGKKLSMASDVFKIYHSTNAAIINESGDLLINQNVSNKDIKISTGSGPTERLRIDSNGRLNHHSGTIVAGTLPYAYFSPPTSSYGGVDLTMNLHDPASEAIGKGGGLGFSAVGSSGNAVVRAAIRGNVEATTSEAGYLTLHTRTNGGGNDERLRIDSAGRVMIGTTIEGNANADDLTIANSGEGGITIRSGSSSNGNIFFSDATSGAGEYAGIIDYKHSLNVMTFGISGTERLRITEGGAEQATLVIDNAGTNGNTWIGDNYTANATEHTCTIGNMYSGAGFFLGYNMKPQSDGWGFVSSQDAYSDRRAGMTLNGSGYDAFRIDVTNANQQITTGDAVTTVKAFAVKHNGDVEIPDGNLVVASGHGIDFSAAGHAGGMTSELLDDYEEGTFVPGTPSYNASSKTAQYTKIGNTVHYQIQVAGISGSASFIIDNLPFTVNAGWGGTIGITNHGGQDHFYTFPHQGMTSLYVRNSNNSTFGTTNSAVAGKFFYIWGTYITNA